MSINEAIIENRLMVFMQAVTCLWERQSTVGSVILKTHFFAGHNGETGRHNDRQRLITAIY